MSSRIAYVGFSSPIFYDYRTPVPAGTRDEEIPNPILESPLGLQLLYDELWFPTVDFCPYNLRAAPYVRFLDLSGRFPPLRQYRPDDVADFFRTDPALDARRRAHYDFCSEKWKDFRDRLPTTWDNAFDHHTHPIPIGDDFYQGHSIGLEALLFDLAIMSHLDDPRVELVTNSFTHGWLSAETSPLPRLDLAEHLTVPRLPEYSSRHGPYHECVLEARDNRFLVHFRDWIGKADFTGTEAAEIAREAEATLARLRNDIFVRHLDERTHFRSLSVTLAKKFIDAAVPFAGPVVTGAGDVGKEVHHFATTRDKRWQAFLASLE